MALGSGDRGRDLHWDWHQDGRMALGSGDWDWHWNWHQDPGMALRLRDWDQDPGLWDWHQDWPWDPGIASVPPLSLCPLITQW